MNKTLVVLALVFLVGVYAHGGYHHGKNSNSNKTITDRCSYKTTKGVQYDLRLLEHELVSDLQYYDASTSQTFYFRPCGAVTSYHQGKESCPDNSAVCVVSSSGKAVNFGSSKSNILWADGVEDRASVEAAYGNGEICNNGAPRKTFVEYVCNINKVGASNAITKVSMIDDCTAKIVIEGAFACPVASYCASVKDEETCKSQVKLCSWENGKCHESAGCTGWKHMHSINLLVVILIASAGILSVCTLCLCVCACKKRRRCTRRRTMMANRKARCQKKVEKKVAKKEEADYAPFQMPFQLIPGGYVPVNPYSNIQGYPMVDLSAPTEEQV